MLEPESAHRFANRVDDYVKFRPSYPDGLVDFIIETIGVPSGDEPLLEAIADVGSGTGLSTRVLSTLSCTKIYAVEPNDEMREASAKYLTDLVDTGVVQLVKGVSDCTTLPSDSVDVIFAGQAFHWFEHSSTKKEFWRILKPAGGISKHVVLFWNIPEQDGAESEFTSGYLDVLKRHGNDYEGVSHYAHMKREGLRFFEDFFQRESITTKKIPNPQTYSWEHLLGRVTSKSYMPQKGDEGYVEMEAELRELYSRFSSGEGPVVLEESTHVVCGTLAKLE